VVGAALAWLLVGTGFANYDAAYSLVWGRDLARGNLPNYDVPVSPTPHPLSNLAGAILSPLGDGAETALVVIAFLALGALAAANTAQIFLVKDSFHGGDFGYGLVFGAIGLGLAVGSFAVAGSVRRRPIAAVYAASILLDGIGLATAGALPTVWSALPFFVLAGIGNGAAIVCNSLLVQRATDDEIRGRVFTVVMSVTYLGFAAGFLVAGPLTDAVGPRWIFAGAGAALAVGAASAYAFTRRLPALTAAQIEAGAV
jgi:MFS family permease